jgi:hypothetical protein
MKKKYINQENDIRDCDIFKVTEDKKRNAHVPSFISEMSGCRFSGVQEPERKSDVM